MNLKATAANISEYALAPKGLSTVDHTRHYRVNIETQKLMLLQSDDQKSQTVMKWHTFFALPLAESELGASGPLLFAGSIHFPPWPAPVMSRQHVLLSVHALIKTHETQRSFTDSHVWVCSRTNENRNCEYRRLKLCIHIFDSSHPPQDKGQISISTFQITLFIVVMVVILQIWIVFICDAFQIYSDRYGVLSGFKSF